MLIKRIQVSNFKSYKSLDIELGQFNVLIGANAAGKSNFIRIFRFLRDIIDFGLENAVSLQGGAEYMRNLNLTGKDDALEYKVSFTPDKPFKFFKTCDSVQYGFLITELIFEFQLGFSEDSSEYYIKSDKLCQKFDAYNLRVLKSGKYKRGKLITSSNFTISKSRNKFSFEFDKTEDLPFNADELRHTFFLGDQSFVEKKKLLHSKLMGNVLMLQTPMFFMPHVENIKSDISGIAVYDFDPKLPKQVTKIAAKADLEENGENLSIVLKKILANEDKRRTLFNLINDILPFVDNLDVEKMFDKTLLLKLREVYSDKHYLPASLISDGTISIIALIVALYFEKNPVAFFEEAERRIHPHLISKVIDMMKDASAHKQIIVSTHNPEVVKYAGLDLESLMLVSRDKEGYSTMDRPHKKKDLSVFLKNEIGIEELFVQNLLG
jgi:predicted ATPase